MKPEPLPKESLTVTHLRKLHRQRASRQCMERIAGGARHFRHLDETYGITGPAKPEPLIPITTWAGCSMVGERRKPGRPMRPREHQEPLTIADVPDICFEIARLVQIEWQLDVSALFSTRATHDMMRPRSAFVGIVEEVLEGPKLRLLAFVLHRDVPMIRVYSNNHEQFLTQPEYTLKVERIIAAVNERRAAA